MKYVTLGRSGLRVSELSLGTMTFGTDWDFGGDRDVSRAQFDAYAEAGGNFIDTADIYTDGTSEKYVGEFVANSREDWVVATKYTFNFTRPGVVNAHGNHRKHMVEAVEASLKRMNLEYIDLLWVHAWDGMTPVDEMMRAFDDLVRAGKIFYVGVSDFPAWRIAQANTLAELRGWTPFVGVQIEFSLLERTVERELFPMAEAFDLSLAAWSPLAGGVLTGKHLDSKADSRRRDNNLDRIAKGDSVVREVMKIARECGRSPAQVALNWVRSSPRIIPIIAGRTMEQLQDNLGCLEWTLDPGHRRRLDEVSAIDPGFPGSFLSSDRVRSGLYGDFEERMVKPSGIGR